MDESAQTYWYHYDGMNGMTTLSMQQHTSVPERWATLWIIKLKVSNNEREWSQRAVLWTTCLSYSTIRSDICIWSFKIEYTKYKDRVIWDWLFYTCYSNVLSQIAI